MSHQYMPAGAVPTGAYVRVGADYEPIEIVFIERNKPKDGKITWTDIGGQTTEIGTDDLVLVIDMPKEDEGQWNLFDNGGKR